VDVKSRKGYVKKVKRKGLVKKERLRKKGLVKKRKNNCEKGKGRRHIQLK
jgi:hypothetical protein